MITLGIETSCDETSLALLETRGEYPKLEYRVIGHVIHSQIDVHRQYGGVFPMMAKREHAKRLVPLLQQALSEAGLQKIAIHPDDGMLSNIRKICGEHDEDLYRSIVNSSLVKEKPAIDRIAVTEGPGLEPALWVGINFATALGTLWGIPVVGINHMEGHIVASLVEYARPSGHFTHMKKIAFPSMAMLLSGGHTEIVSIKKFGDYTLLGQTRDDAVGEAFDKVARMLGLPYPGGPEIAKLAEKSGVVAKTEKDGIARKESEANQGIEGDSAGRRGRGSSDFSAEKLRAPETLGRGAFAKAISFPRPMINSGNLDMSFSGLKTAVLYELKKHPEITDDLKIEIAAEFQNAVVETIAAKAGQALKTDEYHALITGGGVLGNSRIREALAEVAERRGMPFHPPALGLSGDNALMIALASAIRPDRERRAPLAASGNLSLGAKSGE